MPRLQHQAVISRTFLRHHQRGEHLKSSEGANLDVETSRRSKALSVYRRRGRGSRLTFESHVHKRFTSTRGQFWGKLEAATGFYSQSRWKRNVPIREKSYSIISADVSILAVVNDLWKLYKACFSLDPRVLTAGRLNKSRSRHWKIVNSLYLSSSNTFLFWICSFYSLTDSNLHRTFTVNLPLLRPVVPPVNTPHSSTAALLGFLPPESLCVSVL